MCKDGIFYTRCTRWRPFQQHVVSIGGGHLFRMLFISANLPRVIICDLAHAGNRTRSRSTHPKSITIKPRPHDVGKLSLEDRVTDRPNYRVFKTSTNSVHPTDDVINVTPTSKICLFPASAYLRNSDV